MSCNGCRVLRRGCSQSCLLRQCLQRIETPEAQANATHFVAKFFGRSNLLSKIDSVPEEQRSDLFESLLFEACGRSVNPVGGAIGLLSTGNWHICQRAVQIVLGGGSLQISISGLSLEDSIVTTDDFRCLTKRGSPGEVESPVMMNRGRILKQRVKIDEPERFSSSNCDFNNDENFILNQPKLFNFFS